ncbi:MAG: acyl-CoA thioesterase [Elusimicrobiota bacterium]
MKKFEFVHNVTPDEVDAFGHVNNVSYIRWFNFVAARHCQEVGHSGADMWKNGFGWIIKSHKIDYIVPVKPYEKLKIYTEVVSVKAASSLRKYSVLNERGEVCATGETLWVWVDYKTGKPARIPEEVAAKFGF